MFRIMLYVSLWKWKCLHNYTGQDALELTLKVEKKGRSKNWSGLGRKSWLQRSEGSLVQSSVVILCPPRVTLNSQYIKGTSVTRQKIDICSEQQINWLWGPQTENTGCIAEWNYHSLQFVNTVDANVRLNEKGGQPKLPGPGAPMISSGTENWSSLRSSCLEIEHFRKFLSWGGKWGAFFLDSFKKK